MKNSLNPPVYTQVAFDMATKIATGEIKEGERFTGRSLMGSQYGVSPETIRRAMRHLGDMGIISTQANVGSTVLSQKRALEYVEHYQAGRNLRLLKANLRDMIEERDILNEKINETFKSIVNLSERFRSSDQLRTYEFNVEANGQAAGHSIGELQFRQKTGATIVAIQRDKEVLLSPGPQTILEPGNILVVACDIAQVRQVSELLGCGINGIGLT